MGINAQSLKFFLNEHKYKRVEGEFLSLGRQTVMIPVKKIESIFQEYNLEFNSAFEVPDHVTRHAKLGLGSITDDELFSNFPNLNYATSDYDDYEEANLTIDMNLPIDEKLHNRFDLIYSGGVLDNIFNPAMGLINIHKMLKPGGRIFIAEAASTYAGVYTSMSPEWFYSFFAINGYEDVQAYVFTVREVGKNRSEFSTDLFKYSPYFVRDPEYDYVRGAKNIDGFMHNLIIAEKSSKSSSDLNYPIQSHYLFESALDWRTSEHKYSRSKRSIPLTDFKNEDTLVPLSTTHYRYIGSGF